MNTISNTKRLILRGGTLLFNSAIASTVISIIILGVIAPETTRAETFLGRTPILGSPILIKNGYPTIYKIDGSSFKVIKKIKMVVTAYSSTPEQTDNTPFITSSGKNVADGIVANNMLPFGAKIRIPELYGDKIFVVEDRMHQRKGKYHLDIWLPEYLQAKKFGAKITYIEVLES